MSYLASSGTSGSNNANPNASSSADRELHKSLGESAHHALHHSLNECCLFERGFGGFLQSGAFADVTIVDKDQNITYDLHKIILAYSSKYFSKYFDELEKGRTPAAASATASAAAGTTSAAVVEEKKIENRRPDLAKDRIELQGPFAQYFNLVVKYVYEGRVDFTPENAIPMLAMANFYQIKDLKKAASDFLLTNITRENALMMIQKAVNFDAEDVANKCIGVICKNFNQMASSSPTSASPISSSHSPSSSSMHHIPTHSTISFNSLPLSMVVRILKQNNLAVSSEYIVYKTVCSYIESNKSSLSPEDVIFLFETVRFPWLAYQQLAEAEENAQVPRHLLTEALLLRLRQHEAPGKEKDHKRDHSEDGPQNPRVTPRAAYAISLEYQSDFDERGLFYYIGTNGGKEEWSNPGVRGRVRVTCSSQEKGNVLDVVGRTQTECWTMDVPASWVMINLGSTRSLVPNCYTLRHGGNSKADCLRNWTLQGSNDAKNWTVLIRHSNDTSLNGNFATCSWPIPNCTQVYRYFRVLQTGRNSSNNNFLSFSGIEFYGDLYETRKVNIGSSRASQLGVIRPLSPDEDISREVGNSGGYLSP